MSNRTIAAEVKGNGSAWLAIEGSDGVNGNGYITISQRGKLELIEQLAALTPGIRAAENQGEAVAAGGLTDDQLSRRLIATARAMQIRMTEAEEEEARRAKAKASLTADALEAGVRAHAALEALVEKAEADANRAAIKAVINDAAKVIKDAAKILEPWLKRTSH